LGQVEFDQKSNKQVLHKGYRWITSKTGKFVEITLLSPCSFGKAAEYEPEGRKSASTNSTPCPIAAAACEFTDTVDPSAWQLS